MEIWKDYDNNYKVSNTCKVYSMKLERELKLSNQNGYRTTAIYGKTTRVHRLVGTVFIDNVDNKPYINHINGIRHDNRVENLEWCTHSENIKHAHKIGLIKTKSKICAGGKDNGNAKKIKQYSLSGEFVRNWEYIKEASDYYGVSSTSIIKALKNNEKTSCGYRWE